MVIFRPNLQSRRAILTMDLVVAMAILTIAILPVGYSFLRESRAYHASFYRAVAMEIVDGELEILAAGEWRAFPEGTNPYTVIPAVNQSLPPGEFQFTRSGKYLRLEWMSSDRRGIGKVTRETTLE